MYISASSIFITLLMALMMIWFFHFLTDRKKMHFLFRSDLLMLLATIIGIRLFLPVEFPFTKTITFSALMNPLQTVLYSDVLGFTLWRIIVVIWLVGILITGFYSLYKVRRVILIQKFIEKKSKIYHISDFMKVSKELDYPVWKTSLISTPMVLGWKKVILLPDISFTQKELENILSHELQHIINHDIWIKQAINILTILYWWFLPVYWLKNQIQIVLELRVDEKVTRRMTHEQMLDYISILVEMKEKVKESAIQKKLQFSSSFFLAENQSILSYRVQYLLDSKWNKKTNRALLLVVITLPLITNLIIFEPYYEYSPQTDGTWSEQDIHDRGHLIHHRDGSYTFYMDGQEATIENVQDPVFKDLEIVEEQ